MEEKLIDMIKQKLKNDSDVTYREIHTNNNDVMYVVYIGDLCDTKFISEYIVTPLSRVQLNGFDLNYISKRVLVASSVETVNNAAEAVIHILSGDALIIFDSLNTAVYCEAKGLSKRSINTPPTEGVIKGPREGFNEAAVDNVCLIRRRIKSPDLKFEYLYLGSKSHTLVVLVYIENIVPKKLLNHIKSKLNAIDGDYVLNSNYIEEELSEKHTAFDTVGYTEKPDIVSAKISEGRIAIIVDGTPFVITAPYFFIEGFQMPDDYYLNKYLANWSRGIRYVAFFSAALLPALYVAITTFHFNLIPSVFAFRMAVARADVPFPTSVELIIMLFFFQLLREAGIRLPQPIGQVMSIVGALILGDAATGAGITSQVTVLIVAVSSISSFLLPKLYSGISIWSIILIFFSSLLGLPGFYAGFIVLVAHLAGLTTCGYPYLYPFGTLKTFKYKDLLARGYLNEISNNILDGDESNEKNSSNTSNN